MLPSTDSPAEMLRAESPAPGLPWRSSAEAWLPVQELWARSLVREPRSPLLRGQACVGHSVVPHSLRPHALWSARLLCPWDFPGKSTGVGCHSHLQGILRQIVYQLSHQRNPKKLALGGNWDHLQQGSFHGRRLVTPYPQVSEHHKVASSFSFQELLWKFPRCHIQQGQGPPDAKN